MPDLTPVDELRAAAERIRVALDPAPPCQHPNCGHCEGWHKEDSDGYSVCTGCDYDAHDYINPGLEMPKGVGLPLLDLFEDTADRWRDDLRPEGLAVLHVARAVLTGGQP